MLTLLKQRWPKLCGLRVFELHESHGLHVHLLTNSWIDVNAARVLAHQAGWGRIHVTRMPAEHAGYVGKYLSKERPPCFKCWRLWAGFGAWDFTRAKDVFYDSPFSRIYRACKEWLGWEGKRGFFERMKLVEFLEMRSGCEGWEDGFGPNGKPFWMCCREELFGDGTFEAPF